MCSGGLSIYFRVTTKSAAGLYIPTVEQKEIDTVERVLPDDSLQFIQRCVKSGKVLWTYHVNMRMTGRFIPRQAIVESYEQYKIIEEYPDDKYLPSYLVYSEFGGDVFHILFAVDINGDNVRIITAYRPSHEEWKEDLKTRRRSS